MRSLRRRSFSASGALALLFALLGASCTGGDSSTTALQQRPMERAQTGTVETLAGPVFCEGGAMGIPHRETVGALAVDAQNRTYADLGRPQGGLVEAVDRFDARLLRLGENKEGEPPGAGRLASAGEAGLFAAYEKSVVLVDPQGRSVQTVVGGAAAAGLPGGSGASKNRLAGVRAISSDGAGNLYIADLRPGRGQSVKLLFLNRSSGPVTFYPGTGREVLVGPGEIKTIAGEGARRPAAGEHSALEARLDGALPALAVAENALYLANFSAKRGSSIQIVNLGGEVLAAHGLNLRPGEIKTLAAGGVLNGSPAKSRFSYLPGIAADGSRSLLVADESRNRILKIDDQGRTATFAGSRSGKAGFNGNERSAAGALLNRPFDVKVGGGGRVYISDRANRQVRFVDASGKIHRAPSYGPLWRCSSPGKGGQEAGRPQAGKVGWVASDGKGSTYFDNQTTGQILVRTGQGKVKQVRQSLHSSAAAMSPKGGLYLTAGAQVRYLNMQQSAVEVNGVGVGPGALKAVAGGKNPSTRGGPGALNTPLEPFGGSFNAGEIAADSRGSLFIAEVEGRRVRRIDATGKSTIVAGEGASVSGAACCTHPIGVAVDPSGNLYVSDLLTARIWFINLQAQPVVVQDRQLQPGEAAPVAGNGQRPSRDPGDPSGAPPEGGRALDVPVALPAAMAADRRGSLYFTWHLGHNPQGLVKVDAAGKLHAAAGTGQAGFNGDGRDGLLTRLNGVTALVIDACGDLLMADSGNDRIRRLNLAGRSDPAACR